MRLPINYNTIPYTERYLVRNEYIKRQKGKCAHCQELLSGPPPTEILNLYINEKLFPTGFFNSPVHLHHSHDTGMTIGAIHNYCNAVLWQYHGE